MQHFCFLHLSKEQLCGILVFGNVRFNKVVQINHDNVASKGAVGRTHTIVRLQTWNRRKDHGTENFGGFVYVLDGFLQRDFVLWIVMCSINFSLSFPSTTPRATTPHLSLFSGYHAEGYHAPPIPYGYNAEGYHARTDTFKITGYHVCRVTTPELPRSIQTSGYMRVITPAGSF